MKSKKPIDDSFHSLPLAFSRTAVCYSSDWWLQDVWDQEGHSVEDCGSLPTCQASDRCDQSGSRGHNWCLNMTEMSGGQYRIKTDILGAVSIG